MSPYDESLPAGCLATAVGGLIAFALAALVTAVFMAAAGLPW